jgi:hypothetical protein
MSIKEQVVKVCKSIQQETINNLKSAMEESQKSANEYGPPKDRYDSFRTQLLRKRDMYAQQLAKANNQLEVLNTIDLNKNHDRVTLGSLVFTDKQNLFISIGLGKLEVNNQTFFAISPFVPIYKAMEGKKKGQAFVFNNNNFKILDIL